MGTLIVLAGLGIAHGLLGYPMGDPCVIASMLALGVSVDIMNRNAVKRIRRT